MVDDPAIARFDVLPDYGSGFVFHWRMRGGFNDPSPWRYRVQMGFSQDGEWKDVSPVIEDHVAWKAESPIRVNKSQVLFFRLVCDTPSGHYETDARVRFSIAGNGILMFDRESGRMIASGRVEILK